MFKSTLHVGHIENQKIQDYNDTIIYTYIIDLQNSNKCYETQVKQSEGKQEQFNLLP